MPYLQITDFKFGLDRRRERSNGIPGTLWLLENAHISRGGDVQRAKKFVPTYTLPAGTFGLSQVRGQLYVFGSVSTPSSMPLQVQYQRLQSGSANMTGVLDVRSFDGKLYVIASFDDGGVYHFFDGTRITDWDTISNTAASLNLTASYLSDQINTNTAVFSSAVGPVITVTARVPGTAFTISSSATNNGADNTQSATTATPQANVAEVLETRATAVLTVTGGTPDPGVNFISSITINAVELLSQSVNFVGSNNATATAIAVKINNSTLTHGYVAQAAGANVTITAAAGTGATPNAYAVTRTVAGNTTVTAPATMSGGVTYVAPVAQISTVTLGGVFEAVDRFSIVINGATYATTGRAAATGTYAWVYKRRIYSPANSLLNYCQINDAADWTDVSASSGAGFINMSNESEGSQRLVAAAQYGTYGAIFSNENIRLYNLETDAQQNNYYQQIDNTGTIAARSVVPYGNSEVFYLDTTGIRSLRARDSLNIIAVNDIGTAIDPFVRDIIESLPSGVVSRAVGIVEPIDGRYWLAIDNQILVLSYFPSAKINAWSVYKPGFAITDMARIRDRIYARSGNTIYVYGGLTGNVYPNAGENVVKIYSPFLDAKDPASGKMVEAFDIACRGVWRVWMLPDPNDDTKRIEIGSLDGNTYSKTSVRNPFAGAQSLMAYELECSSAGYASVSSIAGHYESSGAT